MHRTYELYFTRGAERTFHALTCPKDELMHRAIALLEERGADRVEVHEAGQPKFTFDR